MVRCWRKALGTWRTGSDQLVEHFRVAGHCDEAAGDFDVAGDPGDSTRAAARGVLLMMVGRTDQEACDTPRVAPWVA